MEKWFSFNWQALLAILLTTVGVYIAVIIFTRIAGKRSFSKMSSFDFAMTVAVGSVIATTVVSKSVSLWEGIAGLAAIYILQMAVASLRELNWIQKSVDNTPRLLMDGSRILKENLRKSRVSEDDLRSKLREANVLDLKQVKAVVFEATGDVSVLHTGDSSEELDDWLLKNVER